MKILQLVHTALQFEPPVFALGQSLARRGHDVICVGYWLPDLAATEHLSPNYELVRIARGDWGWLPRITRGGVRFSNYWKGVRRLADQFQPELLIPMGYDVLPLATEISTNDQPVLYYCTEYSPKPGFRQYSTGWGFLKRLEKKHVQQVDLLVSVEETRAKLQERDWNRSVDHIVLNSPLFDHETDNIAESGLKITHSKIRLVYAGSIDARNTLLPLIEAVTKINAVALDFYGRIIPEYEKIFLETIRSAESRSGGRVRYRGTVPYTELARKLVEYDIGISFYDNRHINTRLASPAKLFEYMRSGLALMSTPQPTPKQVIDETQSGIVVDASNAEHLISIFQDLSTDRSALFEMRRNSLFAFRSQYAYGRQAGPVLDWIDGLSG